MPSLLPRIVLFRSFTNEERSITSPCLDQFPDSSLADLYDPLTMPAQLLKAHTALDKAVDICYRAQPFTNDTKRMEFLFTLYDKYTAGMFGNLKAVVKRHKPKSEDEKN